MVPGPNDFDCHPLRQPVRVISRHDEQETLLMGLPALDLCGFKYLAEGRANVVYRIVAPQRAEKEVSEGVGKYKSYDIFDNKLLRLRKDLPTSVPCWEGHHEWLKRIRPVFHDCEIVEQQLLKLKGSSTIDRLNEELRFQELGQGNLRSSKQRPIERRGVYLADDDYGLLVRDMTPRNEQDFVFEFKPKWLSQSPNAPANSRRCRQCARIARKNAERTSNGKPLLGTYCPLDLISKEPLDIAFVALKMLRSTDPARIGQVVHWLETNTLLPKLAEFQTSLDRQGALQILATDDDLLVAMTLRDCSVFVRFSNASSEATEARIGDLDLKSNKKMDYWKGIEQFLIDERWYLGLEGRAYWQPMECHLNRNRWRRRGNSV